MMADHAPEVPGFLRKPLYIFHLPTELLLSLQCRNATQSHPALADAASSIGAQTEPDPNNDRPLPTSTSCALCHSSFASVLEQREHVRSDFHRYNLKLQLKELPPVDEATFTNLVGDLDESISASDSSEYESEDNDGHDKSRDSALIALLKHQARASQNSNDDYPRVKPKKQTSGTAPLFWLSSSRLPENTSLGVYRALLTESERTQDLVKIIKVKQLKPVYAKHGNPPAPPNGLSSATPNPHYFLCMTGGGHFAAMIICLASEIGKGPGGEEERHAIVKAHKTFHRYTTRRKQGGSQSTNDNAKGNAHSAGSSLRRYNEKALEVDIRSTLSEWKGMIDRAELLFVRATGSTSRRTLYGPHEGQVLRSNDSRIRGFPFSTRRATQAELMRAFTELTRLKISTVSQAALQARDTGGEEVRRPEKPEPLGDQSRPKPSKEEEAALLHTAQIQALIRRTKAPALLSYLRNNNLPVDFRFYPPSATQHHHASTALHLAASTNSPAVVLALLTKAGANPTVANGDGQTAFDIAGDNQTRNAFRISRHLLGESAFDWGAAHVPLPLTEQEVEDRQRREKVEEGIAETKRRNIELEKLRQEEEAQKLGKIEKRAGVGQSLGNREKFGAEKREEEGRGLTPEMKAKLERERRARAAEERIKRMQERG